MTLHDDDGSYAVNHSHSHKNDWWKWALPLALSLLALCLFLFAGDNNKSNSPDSIDQCSTSHCVDGDPGAGSGVPGDSSDEK